MRNENIQTVKEEASFNWSKSFKQKDFYFFRKWKHFQKHREHHLPFLPSSPTVIETKAQKQIFPTEKDLLPLQRELCTGSSSNSQNHCLPTRKMMIIMDRNPNTHKKSNTPGLTTDTGRVLRAVRRFSLTNAPLVCGPHSEPQVLVTRSMASLLLGDGLLATTGN